MTDEIRMWMAFATLGFYLVALVFALLTLREVLKIRKGRKRNDRTH